MIDTINELLFGRPAVSTETRRVNLALAYCAVMNRHGVRSMARRRQEIEKRLTTSNPGGPARRRCA